MKRSFVMEKVKEEFKRKETIIYGRGKAIVSNEVRDYSKDSFFIKKAAEAKEALSKMDLSILKKK